MRLSIKRASSFCNIAVLCYFYVKRVVSRCDILVLLDKDTTVYSSVFHHFHHSVCR